MPDERNFKTHNDYLQWYRRYRKKNRIKIRNYNKEFNKQWRFKNGYKSEIKWQKNNPEKVKVSQLLNYAVRIGMIERKPCEVCDEGDAQGHHEDYSKPLKVKWLCAVCHSKRHHPLF